ncbi:ACT domain-containing protein [Streptomyces sp. NEAU-W12]|uniref:ACT domain-containing protein n=1 Tax=Streptomyces sp. NEAU-W12 TaxID=2994668 RepID=UPI00224AE57D|nr:ACT domain-containing protein [Streptomyces sp. NEAU-W12]MCX2928566.1 ACT domain-containing protein [Streptomyces sp. NEAU-W12]
MLRLGVLSTVFVVERLAGTREPPAGGWHALVRAPEGLTVVRDAGADTAAEDRWTGLYDLDAGHGLNIPGLLASVVGPLADAGVPVFVVSTYDADLVLVPAHRTDDMAVALEAAGHELVRADTRWDSRARS